MKAADFDKKFDDGDDVSEYLNFTKATRVNQKAKRFSVDFPVWVVDSLDRSSAFGCHTPVHGQVMDS